MSEPRPVYIGTGECECKRPDVQIYKVPNTIADRPLCKPCIESLGFKVPAPRTAEDIEVVNGVLTWRR